MNDTRFKTGQKPWNVGMKNTWYNPVGLEKGWAIGHEKIKDRIHKVCLRTGCANEFDVKPSLDRVKYCSRSCVMKGKTSPMKGQKASLETRMKQSIAKIGIRGEAHPLWTGTSTQPERRRLMQHYEYRVWRTDVFVRDDYTCQDCGVRGGQLQADHIKPWALYPELRYDLSNGQTLCISCHRKTPTWGGKTVTRGKAVVSYV